MRYPTPRFLMVLAKTTLLALFVCVAMQAHASVLFEDSVQDFQVSGPVALSSGQNASVCATNLDDSPVSILIGLLQADGPSILAVKQVTLASGAGACLNFTRQLQPNGNPQSGANVIGVVLQGGRVNSQGAIVQDRPGGGCIAASLQIQFGAANNTPTQTFLYVPMQEHHEARHRDRD
ncbi:MAG TPA: hypothetical protein VFA71_06430 [Terriglobales bacterium]|nr:hypothetical protein [Terriglobales bacterium]